MRRTALDVIEVAERQACCGCGICAALDPASLEMTDVPAHGRRPRLRPGVHSASPDTLSACPGTGLSHPDDAPTRDPAFAAWGPIRGVWEGWASDGGIRWGGSSGGAASALALFALEQMAMSGVVHIAARRDVPYLNETVFSRTREELLQRTGSRYAPASPCDGIHHLEKQASPGVFIGKPCDVAGLAKACSLHPEVAERVGLTIAIFCAGTPSLEGTLEMLARMGIDKPEQLLSLRYRGNGWPGHATAVVRGVDGTEQTRQLTYTQSWGQVLQKHRQWRCHVCADHTGEFADIAVGDPWYRPIAEGEPGDSLIVARTERGKRIIEAAIAGGYLVASPSSVDVLEASQPNLLRTRGAVWGRLLVMRDRKSVV